MVLRELRSLQYAPLKFLLSSYKYHGLTMYINSLGKLAIPKQPGLAEDDISRIGNLPRTYSCQVDQGWNSDSTVISHWLKFYNVGLNTHQIFRIHPTKSVLQHTKLCEICSFTIKGIAFSQLYFSDLQQCSSTAKSVQIDVKRVLFCMWTLVIYWNVATFWELHWW